MAAAQGATSIPRPQAGAVTPEMLRQAVAAGVVTFLVTSLIIGIQTVSSTGTLDFTTRYKEVIIASIGVFVGSLVVSQMRAGRPIVGVVVGGGVTVAVVLLLLVYTYDLVPKRFLPFNSMIVNWGSLIVPAAIFLRALLLMQAQSAAARGRPAFGANAGDVVQRLMPWVGAGLIVIAVVIPLLPLGDRTMQKKVIDICTIVLTYVMLGWGLNIVVGLAGLLDLGYVAFYAVGAYTYAMLSVYFGLSFWICLPLAGLLAAMFGVLLGFPVLRLRGDYLAIVTLGFGEMIRIIIVNWRSLTGGPNGITNVPMATFFGLPIKKPFPEGTTSFQDFFGLEYNPNQRVIFLYYLVLLAALVVNFFTLRIRKLPLGRAWEALREDETACRALGINPTNTKLTAFAIGAMFGGFAGSFFAVRNGFISPESFVFLESAIILAIVVLGGLGSQVGIVLAAAVLIGLPEMFRELSEYRMLAFGIGMVLIMIWRPGGLLAHREPTIRLHPANTPPGAAQSGGLASAKAK